jgi:redox-sensitive bicupin YhaK (pirin superfamily)
MKVIQSHKKDLGDQFLVRRILPSIQARNVGPFVFLDHFGPVPLKTGEELVVRPHPHIGLATITYLYSGAILHRDSLGTEGMIRPREVNWMTAGHGIVHSERSKKEPGEERLEGIQAWVALPKDSEEVDPEFFHYPDSDIPTYQGLAFNIHLIAGNWLEMKSPVKTYSPLFYSDFESSTDCQVELSVNDDWESAVYLSQGGIHTEEGKIEIGQMLFFSPGENIRFEAEGKTRAVILGGLPHSEKRHLFWNFVSSSEEKIQEAKKRWEDDLFPKVPNEMDRIPLP